MYIACPECDTKFVITPEQIGIHGRKVKCSKCAHIWHQKLEKPIKIAPSITPEVASPLGNGVNLPALLPVKIAPYLYTMPIMLIGMIILMMALLFPNYLGLESILNNEALSIKDVSIENQHDIDKITVNYKVLNSSSKDMKIPLIRVRLFDKNNRVLKSHIVDPNEKHQLKAGLAPKQYVHIKTEFIPAPENTESVDIMLGNRLDFILR